MSDSKSEVIDLLMEEIIVFPEDEYVERDENQLKLIYSKMLLECMYYMYPNFRPKE